jgi:hypothetical protein
MGSRGGLRGLRDDRRRGDGGQGNVQPGVKHTSPFHMLHVHDATLGHATTLTLAHPSASWT